MPEVKKNATAMIVVDNRFPSLIISSFIGTADLEIGRWFAETQKRIMMEHAAAGRRVITINDSTHAGRPSAEMRQFWGEMASSSTPSMQAATIANMVVVNNPLIRGAITAIGWMSPSLRDMETFSTVDLALGEAIRRLEKMRLPGPFPAIPYVVPDSTAAQAIASGKR